MIPKSKNRVKPYKGFGRSKKVDAWSRLRAKLKIEFAEMNVTRCEMCNADNFLSFAHRLKRRFITTDEELRQVALLCIPCHEKLEYGDKQVMFDKISEIIERRI